MSEHILVVSHRRSGTHLTIDAIVNNFRLYSSNPDVSKVTLEHLTSRVDSYKYIDLRQFQENIGSNPCVIKTHAHANLGAYFNDSPQLTDYVNRLFSRAKVIYVYRDGRDVLTSLYFYMQTYDPIYKDMSLSEFIRMDNTFDHSTYSGVLSRVGYWNYHVSSWIDSNDKLFLSFDDLIDRYDETIEKIGSFIGQPICHRKPKDIRILKSKKGMIGKLVKSAQDTLIPLPWQKRVRRRFQRVRRSSVSFREGRSRDWLNYFKADDLRYFNDLTKGLREELGRSADLK